MKEETVLRTTQLTSQSLKAHLLLGMFCWVTGLIALFNHAEHPFYIWLFIGGLFWHIVTKIRIWWNHG